MTTQHTPGPWFYRRGDEWSHDVVTHHGELPDGSTSCWTVASINKRREPEHVANARLIAAAPDLLEALKRVMPFIDCIAAVTREEIIEYEAAMKMADAAIKKAIGQE